MLVTVTIWLGAPHTPPSLAATDSTGTSSPLTVHDTPMDESIDFYQYTDEQGGIHFVDSREKIPARYWSRTIVRKDIPSARQTTRVVIADNQVHVPVTLKRGERTEQATMLMDTGASMTIINQELAARLNIDPANSPVATIRMADGRFVDIRVATIDQVSVGSRSKTRMKIGILHRDGRPEQHDGLLGFDFIGDFQYQLDLGSQMIRWQ